MRISMATLVLVLAPALAACSLYTGNDNTVEVGRLDLVMTIPSVPNPNVDVLFLVDNSPSMLDKQTNLIASFPRMMAALGMLEGGLPSVHVGVVTSDMGTQSTLDNPAPAIGSGPGACSGLGDDGKLQHNSPALGNAFYIEDLANPDGSRTK